VLGSTSVTAGTPTVSTPALLEFISIAASNVTTGAPVVPTLIFDASIPRVVNFLVDSRNVVTVNSASSKNSLTIIGFSAMAFTIKQNDTSPQIAAILQDGSGNAIDLTAASVKFHMKKVGATSATVDAAATIVNEDAGSVKYVWVAADTASAGTYQAEFEVTYTNGAVETFPNDQSIAIEITEDLA